MIALEISMSKDLWTWGGTYFGRRERDELWSHHGTHVGRFVGNEVYGPDGRYLGEIKNGKLITQISSNRAGRALFLGRHHALVMFHVSIMPAPLCMSVMRTFRTRRPFDET